MAKIRLPISAVFFGTLGVLTVGTGMLAMGGTLSHIHPLLNKDGGLALVVSGIALILSGGFPLALAILAAERSS